MQRPRRHSSTSRTWASRFRRTPTPTGSAHAGPGPSFIEANGKDHFYAQKTAGWMAHNVVHLARMLKERPIPPEGNTVPCKHAG